MKLSVVDWLLAVCLVHAAGLEMTGLPFATFAARDQLSRSFSTRFHQIHICVCA
jgi:hypothetical protein